MTAQKLREAVLRACQKAMKEGLKIRAHGFTKYELKGGRVGAPRVLTEVCPIGAVCHSLGKLQDAAIGGFVKIARDELGVTDKQVWNFIDGVDYANRAYYVEANKRHPYFMAGVAVARALKVERDR